MRVNVIGTVGKHQFTVIGPDGKAPCVGTTNPEEIRRFIADKIGISEVYSMKVNLNDDRTRAFTHEHPILMIPYEWRSLESLAVN